LTPPDSRQPIAKQPIVRLSDVHLDMASDAGTVNILRGVTLDIAVGEIAAVVGPRVRANRA
jgi:putative ABC transport system ATP-binding protein